MLLKVILFDDLLWLKVVICCHSTSGADLLFILALVELRSGVGKIAIDKNVRTLILKIRGLA